jgi:hypothetical protein
MVVQRRQTVRRLRFERDGAAEFAGLIAELHDGGSGGSVLRSASSAIPQLPPSMS